MTFSGVGIVRRVNVMSVLLEEAAAFVLVFAAFIASLTSPPPTAAIDIDDDDDAPINDAMRMFHNAMQSTIDPTNAIR